MTDHFKAKMLPAAHELEQAFNKPANEDLPDTTQDPGELLESVIEDVTQRYRERMETNRQRAQDAHNTLEACEKERKEMLRYLKALHAARTELTRPE